MVFSTTAVVSFVVNVQFPVSMPIVEKTVNLVFRSAVQAVPH